MSLKHSFGVYTAKFPFLDSDETKLRPVIIVSRSYGQHDIIAVVPVSSRKEREAVDVTINDIGTAGLIKPSVARVHRLTTMLQTDLRARLGELSASDTEVLQKSIRKFLEL
jgi:mRNA interferase MazF